MRRGETRRPDFETPQERNRESGTVTAIVGYFWEAVKQEMACRRTDGQVHSLRLKNPPPITACYTSVDSQLQLCLALPHAASRVISSVAALREEVKKTVVAFTEF